MLVLELYFIFYRVPKMMGRLARERKRSALGWSLLGIGTWIGAEMFAIFALTLIVRIALFAAGSADPEPVGVRYVIYLLGLVTALLAVTFLQRVLTAKGVIHYRPAPPPPPSFSPNN